MGELLGGGDAPVEALEVARFGQPSDHAECAGAAAETDDPGELGHRVCLQRRPALRAGDETVARWVRRQSLSAEFPVAGQGQLWTYRPATNCHLPILLYEHPVVRASPTNWTFCARYCACASLGLVRPPRRQPSQEYRASAQYRQGVSPSFERLKTDIVPFPVLRSNPCVLTCAGAVIARCLCANLENP